MGRAGGRRLLALIDGLPPEAAVVRDGKLWTRSDELAAVLVERNEMWWAIIAQLLGAKPDKLPKLIGFQHPHRKVEEKPKNVVRSPADLKRFLGHT